MSHQVLGSVLLFSFLSGVGGCPDESDRIDRDLPDRDDDGVHDGVDNCPDVPNTNQDDENGDGIGDACSLTCDITVVPEGVTQACLSRMLQLEYDRGGLDAVERACAIFDLASEILIEHSSEEVLTGPDLEEQAAIFKTRLRFPHPVPPPLPPKIPECGEDSGSVGVTTICALGEPEFPEGESIRIGAVMQAEIPLEPDSEYQYMMAIDSDGDVGNNFVAGPPFSNDFYDDRDRAYEIMLPSMDEPYVQRRDFVDGSWTVVPTAARASIFGAAWQLVIPQAELPMGCQPHDLWSFVHDGDYGLEPPHRWSGDGEIGICE